MKNKKKANSSVFFFFAEIFTKMDKPYADIDNMFVWPNIQIVCTMEDKVNECLSETHFSFSISISNAFCFWKYI